MAKSKITKPAIPTPAAPAKGPGVIAALIDLLQNGGGLTTKELYEKLVERLPDRATEKGGMRITITIQLKRLAKAGKLAIKSEQVEGRGVVFSAETARGK